MQSKLKNFLVLFSRLRKETNDSAANLTWLSAEKAHLAGLCYDLDSCYRGILRLLSKKITKHTIAPPLSSLPFSAYWDDYVANWEAAVAEAAGSEWERINNDLEPFLRKLEERAIAEGKKREEFWEEFIKELPIKTGASLDPLVDDPAALMGDIKWGIDYIVENEIEAFEDIFDKKTIGAWNFFEHTICIDYSTIYARWRSTPELFIPAHALNRDITPIVDLYNEAVRAYIFGLTVASVAMCRALLEHVLKRHYHIRGKDLENIIFLAEERHGHLKNLHLQDKRILGNEVLHKYENRAENLDKAALDFLRTLRHVVTHIPESG